MIYYEKIMYFYTVVRNSDIKSTYGLQIPNTEIPENSDLNDYLTPGQYKTKNAASSATIKNTPYTRTGFKLTVEKLSAETHAMQTLKGALSDAIYWRTFDVSKWSEWIALSNNNVYYVEHRIDDFSVTPTKNYTTLGTTTEFGLPKGAHFIGCFLVGWANISSGNIYVTANDSNVYMFCDGPVTADYVRIRLAYIMD